MQPLASTVRNDSKIKQRRLCPQTSRTFCATALLVASPLSIKADNLLHASLKGSRSFALLEHRVEVVLHPLPDLPRPFRALLSGTFDALLKAMSHRQPCCWTRTIQLLDQCCQQRRKRQSPSEGGHAVLKPGAAGAELSDSHVLPSSCPGKSGWGESQRTWAASKPCQEKGSFPSRRMRRGS